MTELHHDAIRITHEPDGELVCIITRPYFNRHDLNKILGNLTKYSENFTVNGYQTGKVEKLMKEASRMYKNSVKK